MSRQVGCAYEGRGRPAGRRLARERPDLDVEPLQVLSRVSRLARHLDRARRAASWPTTWRPGSSTCSPRCAGGTAVPAEPRARCCRATLVTSGTMTNRIDRLAAAGLVRRHPDPAGPARGAGRADRGRAGSGWTPRSPTCCDRERELLAGPRTTSTAGTWPTCCAPCSSPSTRPNERASSGGKSSARVGQLQPALLDSCLLRLDLLQLRVRARSGVVVAWRPPAIAACSFASALGQLAELRVQPGELLLRSAVEFLAADGASPRPGTTRLRPTPPRTGAPEPRGQRRPGPAPGTRPRRRGASTACRRRAGRRTWSVTRSRK